MSTLNLEHIKHENSSSNNITVDSDGSVAVNGNLEVDTNTLFVDAANNRVGIGTSSPVSYGKLHIKAGNGTQLVLDNAGEQFTQMYFNNNGVYKAAIWADNTSSLFSVYGSSGMSVNFYTNDTESMRIDTAGRVTMPYQPAFCVHTPNNGATNDIMKFQTVVVNRGNNYSTSTGLFTAPVTGVYQFNWHMLSNSLEGYHYGYLSKNGNVVVYAQSYTESGIPTTGETITGAAIVELVAGDTAGYYHFGLSYTDVYEGAYSVFSGHLIG